MPCARCYSGNQSAFPGEIAIHSSGRENLDKPHVLVFPEILVCLDCGFSEFLVAEKDLRLLGKGDLSSSAACNANC
jgi:predicted nucleic-acid-binding Zn-ribbon protein